MAKLTAEECATKQATRLKASTEDIRRGIDRVTVAPTQLAAAKIGKMKAKLDEAFSSGRVERNLRAVSLEEWKTNARDIGVNRIAQGIDGAHAKQVTFYGKLLPAVDAAKSKIASMPDVTLEDSISRMTAYIREMNKFKK